MTYTFNYQQAKNQRGLTFLSILLILLLIAFFALLAMKIAPIYMNHSKVINALEAVENTVDVETLAKNSIRNSLNKRFDMNYVEYVEKDDITITKHGNYVKVEIEYERVEEVFGNLSVLVEFYESFEAGESS